VIRRILQPRQHQPKKGGILATPATGNASRLRLTPFSKTMQPSVAAPAMPMSARDIVRR
jgi:hypothetical protein